MSQKMSFSSVESLLNYFMPLLPEPRPGGIAAITRHASVNNERVTLRAVKHQAQGGFIWTYEIHIEQG